MKLSKVCSRFTKAVKEGVKMSNYEPISVMEEKPKIEKSNAVTKLIVVMSIAFAIALIFSVVLISSITAIFTNSEPYKHTLQLIQDNRELQEYLGESGKRKGLISGSISTSGDSSGKATMSFKFEGTNGISRVYVDAYKENGIWNYTKILFYKKPGDPESVNLLEE